MVERIGQGQIHLLNREILEISAVHKVMFYDDQEVLMETGSGPLLVKGEGLHITTLNLEEGKIIAEGYIHRIEYVEDRGAKIKKRGQGIISKLLR